jgi:hypothetical protein
MRHLVCIVAALFAVPAQAQVAAPAVAKLVGISGNVLVSTESTIASAGEALRLSPGMRVLATLNSHATIEYRDGCRVKVNAGERVEVKPGGCAMSRVQGLALAPVTRTRP